jgi:hypothetical protein
MELKMYRAKSRRKNKEAMKREHAISFLIDAKQKYLSVKYFVMEYLQNCRDWADLLHCSRHRLKIITIGIPSVRN